MKGLFTIGTERRFADELARVVLAEHKGDPLALADVLILLPTRRSVRALREAFLRAADGTPTILPRMAPLGDVDDGEWEIASGDNDALALPPAIDPAEREALLARLVAVFTDDRGHPIAQSAAQALKLARELGRLLDELAIEGVSFDRLEGLVEGNFASHWQRTLKFLAIVGEHWPQMLAARGHIDAIERRTLAHEPAVDTGDRGGFDGIAAGNARPAGCHRRPAARRGGPSRPRPRHGRGKLGRPGTVASSIRPA